LGRIQRPTIDIENPDAHTRRQARGNNATHELDEAGAREEKKVRKEEK